MIELPADLAAVLTTLQSHENGAGIAFPDADEDRLAELARAWDAWNTAAEPRVRAIVASAQQAAAHMSGAAADGFQQYLEKYAGRDDAHAVTVLESGLAMARCLHEASGTVGRTKAAMVQQLRSTKEYLDGSTPGAAPGAAPGAGPVAAAQSEGVRLAVDSCRQQVALASADVDAVLRQTAGPVDRMDSAGQACALGGAGSPDAGAGGAGAGAPGSGTGGATGADARPVLAGLGPLDAPRTDSARDGAPGRESGPVCRPGGTAVPGLNLAGFTGVSTGTAAQGGLSSGGAGDPAGTGGASSGVFGAGGAPGPGGAAGGAGGVGGRRAVGGGSAVRARAGAMPSFTSAGFGVPPATAAAAAGVSSRAGAVGHGATGTTRQTLGSGAVGTGLRAGAGTAGAGAAGRGPGPGPGGVHGAGHGGGKKGTRGKRRPGLVVEQGPEEDEVIADSGIHGRATEAPAGDRQEQRAHQRWVDGARTEAAEQPRAGVPQAEAAGEEHPPAPADDLLTQLTSVVLGTDAGSGGPADTDGAEAGGGRTEGRPEGRTESRSEGRPAAPAAYPQGGAVRGPAGPVGAAPAGPDAGGKPAQLREEGGYQVPSPQLRAALAKLAAAGEFDKPAPAGAARRPAAPGESPGAGRPGNDE
ncbi:hypothetical protein [Kitasatospora sp. NPDC047058]|uniref:WXG100-like domain-containing protein n=1 Tax=Kitasatospora sp. NPDC047058 TaxID=3155620 RepID=UPI0033E66E00